MRAAGLAALALLGLLPAPAVGQDRPRARDLGIVVGALPPGPLNAITDVPGVRVGHVTVVEGDSIRSGVTVVVPHEGNVFLEKVPGAIHVANGFGKLAGVTQVEELGTIETPIALTNTLAVGRVVDGLVRWTRVRSGADVRSVNAVVGETNDGFLNAIGVPRIGVDEVTLALESAAPGPVAEGSVGAGTGTVALGFKGGIGTASRRVRIDGAVHTLGVLVQSNFGGALEITGVPVGRALGKADFLDEWIPTGEGGPASGPGAARTVPVPWRAADQPDAGGGSIMIVVATDAPLETLRVALEAARQARVVAHCGNPSASSDVRVALELLEAAAAGATANVEINLTSVNDQAYQKRVASAVMDLSNQFTEEIAAARAALKNATQGS